MMSETNGKFLTRIWLKVWLLAALLLTLPVVAVAQELQPTPCDDPPCNPIRVRIRGTITNCSGQPVSGVTVFIESPSESVTALTNASGFYSVLLPPDTYDVTPEPTGRYFYSPRTQQSNGFTNTNFTRYPRDNRANFDGDCKTDVSDFNRGSGLWHSLNSSDGQEVLFGFGLSADVITPGDYNGDGRTDYAVFRPGNATWYVATQVGTSFSAVQFGLTADLPAAGDYNGDGQTDIAVFRPANGTWYILQPNGSALVVPFGLTGDIPVPGDYDGDGRADIAVFRPGPADWYILRSSDSQVQSIHWGQSGDRPVQADYDDDGKADIAIFRLGSGDWWILNSSNGATQFVHWGQSGDRPVPGDYDGDGRADIAIQRPDSTGAFWILPSATGSHYVVTGFGQFPVPLGYLSTRNWY